MSSSVVKHHYDRITDTLKAAGEEGTKLVGLARWRAKRRTADQSDAVFIWIPKTAGTSLWHMLEASGAGLYLNYHDVKWVFPNQGIASFGHIRYVDLVTDGVISSRFTASSYKFAIVRNPFDRAVSLFEYLRKHRRIPPQMPFEMFAELLALGRHDPPGLYHVRDLSQCNPQVAWLTDDSGDIIADDIGRMEDIDSFVTQLQTRLEISSKVLPILNQGQRIRDYRPYYHSRSARDSIENYFASDLNTFNYEF